MMFCFSNVVGGRHSPPVCSSTPLNLSVKRWLLMRLNLCIQSPDGPGSFSFWVLQDCITVTAEHMFTLIRELDESGTHQSGETSQHVRYSRGPSLSSGNRVIGGGLLATFVSGIFQAILLCSPGYAGFY